MKVRQNLQTALAAVTILWLVFFIDFASPMDLRLYGLRPRHLDSLAGIVFMPFLHADLRHLIANSGILFVLLAVSLSFSRKLTFGALWIIILVGGGLVWLSGKEGTIHIGASGVIFGLIGFLMCFSVHLCAGHKLDGPSVRFSGRRAGGMVDEGRKDKIKASIPGF